MKKKFNRNRFGLDPGSLFTIAPAEAGSKTRHRWQGAGMALVRSFGRISGSPYGRPCLSTPGRLRSTSRSGMGAWHWEMTQEWVPELGKECGSRGIMIAADIGWRAIT
jgi:hypothetical protein